LAQKPLVGQVLIIDVSRSRSDTPRLVGLLCTSEQLDAETSLPDKAQNSQETDIQPAGGFEPAIPASDRAQTHAFDCAVTGKSLMPNTCTNNKLFRTSST